MRCDKCGFENNDVAKTCAKCGSPIGEAAVKAASGRSKNRRVVKLPSDASYNETAPAEHPWEAPANYMDGMKPGNSGKIPTPRKRTNTTGKIPAIKHPASESGKIPADQRARRAGGAVVGGAAATGAAHEASADQTAPIDLDRRERPKRYDADYLQSSEQAKKNKRFKAVAIFIAVVIVACLIALGIFLASTHKDTMTVAFDTDGGTAIENRYVLEDGQLERPSNPTRDGYTFQGWYLDPEFTDRAVFPMSITGDVTLYAKWQENVEASAPTALEQAAGQTSEDAAPNTAAQPQGSSSSSTGASGSSSSTGATSGSSGSSSGSSGAGSGPSASSGSSSSTGGTSSSGGSGQGTGSNSNPISNGTVQIALVAANGERLTGSVTLHDGYVIPDSSEKAYTVSELKALGLNDAEMCIARNEPYARQGYSFRNPGLQAYFNARSWYHNNGWRGELPADSAGYITAHNLLELEQQSPSAAKWLRLRTS